MTRHCSNQRGRQSLVAVNGRTVRPLPRHHPPGATELGKQVSGKGVAGQVHRLSDDAAGTTVSGAVGVAQRRDRGQGWLRGAMLALAVLAGAAAVVSWDAQYVLVRAVKHNPAVAALEAGIPDVGAVIFAALGIALALHARRAVRARLLNVACVGISLAMNALASAHGWRDLAIWVMPSAVYALASDTLIGVVRAWVIARTGRSGQALADDDSTPIAVVGRSLLWLFRLVMAPASTVAGFRRWVLDQCPVPPRSDRPVVKPIATALPSPATGKRGPRQSLATSRAGTRPGKQAQLLQLAGRRHDLTAIPLTSVSKIATSIAAEVDLAPGTARRVLLAHVRSLQNSPSAGQEAQA